MSRAATRDQMQVMLGLQADAKALLAALTGAERCAPVVPNDGANLASTPKALYAGGAGNLRIQGSDGVAATFVVAAGQILPVRARRVLATGTTATDIVALF